MVEFKRWMFENENIRPYVYMRKENQPAAPGKVHSFDFPKGIEFIDPLKLENADFATMLLALENTAFKSIGLTLPRWALYDCSIMPGLICGFAHRTSQLPDAIRKSLPIIESYEWTPLSLFICIPAAEKDHWIACNLCSVNSLLDKKDSLSCLGFLSKAFGLWYCNIENLYGVTQWSSQALAVHTSYGLFQLVTAFTPVHNIPATITYKVRVDAQLWKRFVELGNSWKNPLKPLGEEVDPTNDEQLISLHHRIERGDGPFYLSPDGDYKGGKAIPLFGK